MLLKTKNARSCPRITSTFSAAAADRRERTREEKEEKGVEKRAYHARQGCQRDWRQLTEVRAEPGTISIDVKPTGHARIHPRSVPKVLAEYPVQLLLLL